MTPTRRRFLQGTAAVGAAVAAPTVRTAKAQATGANEIRAVMHGDLRAFDPIWTTGP